MISRDSVRSRSSGSVMPAALAFIMLIFIAMLMILDAYKDAVLRRRATAIAEAVSREQFRHMQPRAYGTTSYPGNLSGTPLQNRLDYIAQLNGLDTNFIQSIDTSDYTWDTTWASVEVTPIDQEAITHTGITFGVQAGSMREGKILRDDAGNEIGVSGTLPLAIDLNAIPNTTAPTTLSWTLTSPSPFALVTLPSATTIPENYFSFLSFIPGAGLPATAVPPPAVEMGQSITSLTPNHITLNALTPLLGRTVIAPVVQNSSVAAFLRINLIQIDTNLLTVTVSLADSAYDPLAGPSSQIDTSTSTAGSVHPLGQLLRPRTEVKR